jgi:hypothetical protein
MKRISNIGIDIPSDEDNYIRLDSNESLSETDIAIFCPDFSNTIYSSYDSSSFNGNEQYEGKKLYNKVSSAKIIDHTNHWKSEILHFVENGGMMIVVLSKIEDFYIYTGEKSFTGTGKNQKTTYHVIPYSNYNFLPFSTIKFHSASGKSVFPNNNIVNDLYQNCKDYLSFQTYIKGDKISNILFTTKNKDRILGASLQINKGNVIFVPDISFKDLKLRKYNEKTEKSLWTPEAIKVGKMFINSIVEIDKVLRKSMEKSPKPNWLQNESFILQESEKIAELINTNKSEILRRQKEIEKLELGLEENESLKDLLFETGKPLEQAVIKALKILGYKAENYNDGTLELDQIILSPEGERFIGECEGKDTKDIDVSKFRQLLDGLNADFEKETVQEKAFGLLFGNPQRVMDPAERTLSFTIKCVTGAKREKFGLIKTSDLFIVCRHIIEHNDNNFALKCRKAIVEQLGQIIEFPLS